jgi:hypothetical protein
MKKYSVLWFDDEHESLETFKDDALSYGIVLTGYKNADDGLAALNNPKITYDAVLLDGLFFNKHGQAGDAVDNSAFGRVALSLKSLKDRGIIIPWFIFSGQPSFVKERNDLVKVLADNDFGNGKVYDKNKDEDFEELCQEIIKSANEIDITKIKHKYSDVFKACKEKYLGSDSASILIEALKFVEFEDDYAKTIDLFTGLRKLVETLFTRLNKIGIIPDEIYNENSWINPSSYFLSGKHAKYKIHEGIIPPATTFLLKSILQVVQDASHGVPDKLKLKIGQYVGDIKTPYLYKSTVYQLIDVLIWFKMFVDEHPDKSENIKLWHEDQINQYVSEWIMGNVIKIAENGWGTFQPENGGTTVSILPKMVSDNSLSENDYIEARIEPSPDGKKIFIKEIRKV